MANAYLTLLANGLRSLVEFTVTSAGAGDAGKGVGLGSDGRLDTSVMPTGIGADTKVMPASENLAANDFVNIHDDAGTFKVRKCDPTVASAGKRAEGFVKAGVTSGADATVYFEGENAGFSGLAPGYYVTSDVTPGAIVPLADATTTSGESVQIVGFATSATSLNVEIEDPIIRN